MANNYFKFKKFTIFQDRCAMKVNTDSIILGCYADVSNTQRILDIGTGTGLLALILSYKTNSQIDALEIDNEAYIQAKENICFNNKSNQINVLLGDFNVYTSSNLYDLIISNPPYFEEALPTKKPNRNIARYTTTLTHENLLVNSYKLLKENGKLTFCIPFSCVNKLTNSIKNIGFKIERKINIKSSINKDYYLSILSLSKTHQEIFCTNDDLVIRDNNNLYTTKFRQLTSELYLNF